ncbi:glutamic acid-rich protein-like [Ochlerotatus camptorhynchus]|uniref:glutamic acid-rich protein-like n=1 Tax=Ochlerotatus camptorhynchus TaxID=644619 RepID=UPI0031E2A7DB
MLYQRIKLSRPLEESIIRADLSLENSSESNTSVLYKRIISIKMKIVAVFVILAACCLMEVAFAAPSQQRGIEKRHAQEQEPTPSDEEKPSEDSESGTDEEKPEEKAPEEGDKDEADEGDENQEGQDENCHHHHQQQHEDGQDDEGEKTDDGEGQTDVEEPAKSDE